MPRPQLSDWMESLVDYVRSGHEDLTNRQMALLMLVYQTPGPHTVRGLARELNVSKPVVTRALNRLGSLGYLARERDEHDRRNVFVARTRTGAAFLEEFGRLVTGQHPSSARPRRTVALTGPSVPVDTTTYAARRDLAELALADRVFAQHYAEPLTHRAARQADIHCQPRDDSDVVATLDEGAAFHVLDIGGTWAWGRGDAGGTVGYVEASALAAP